MICFVPDLWGSGGNCHITGFSYLEGNLKLQFHLILYDLMLDELTHLQYLGAFEYRGWGVC